MAAKRKHPEDAKFHAKGIVEGQLHARAFCRAHAEAFVALIATYPDEEAERLLRHLREHFWYEPHKWAVERDEELRAKLAEPTEAT